MAYVGGRLELIAAIASKQWTGNELSERFNMPVAQIKRFVEENRTEIEEAYEAIQQARAEISPDIEESELADELNLWIRDQSKRLLIYQTMVEALYVAGRITFDATILRELRSYLLLAANELGQLQHRGSAAGGGATATYEIPGIDLELLR